MSSPWIDTGEPYHPWSTADHHRANPDHRDQWPDSLTWLDPEPDKDTDG